MALSRLLRVSVTVGLLGFSSVANASVDAQAPPDAPKYEVNANLILVFSSRVDLRSSTIEVRDAHHRRIKTGDLRFGDDGVDVEIPLAEPLPPGAYTIHWRAVSVDGRTSVGGYGFTVGPSIETVPSIAQQ
jgi:methionine-rich copper-binding protein CopC